MCALINCLLHIHCVRCRLREAIGTYGEGNWADILGDAEYSHVVSYFLPLLFAIVPFLPQLVLSSLSAALAANCLSLFAVDIFLIVMC